MFGVIVSGRPVDASPQAISTTQFAFRIASVPSFNHIVVFLLPGTQLPPGSAASVYVRVQTNAEFQFLGGIGPGKESAIFKISGLKSATASSNDNVNDGDVMIDDQSTTAPASFASNGNANGVLGEIAVGISIEPAAQVEAQIAQLAATSSSTTTLATPQAAAAAMADQSSALVRQSASHNNNINDRVSTKILAQRIIGNAFNFLASFGSDVVPLKAFQDWWTKFEKKIDLDPSFLERVEQG